MIARNIVWLIVLFMEIALILFLAIKKSNHNLKGFLCLGLTIVLLVFSNWQALFPKVKQIKPTGQYNISYIDTNYIDEDRFEEFDGNNTKRELEVGIWYPIGNFDNNTLPLVIFSHGSFGVINNNKTLCTELASRGYVVCSISHTYQAYTTKLSNGKTIKMSKEYMNEVMKVSPQKNPKEAYEIFSKWMKLRTDDISFVIDTLIDKSKTENECYRLINKEKIITMGHSLGGSAALGMPRLRDDIKLVVALESPFMCDIVGVDDDGNYEFINEEYPIPVLNIYSDSSYSKLGEWKQYKVNYDMLNAGNSKYQSVYMEGIGHMHLCDFSLTSPMLSWFLSGKDSKTSAKVNLQKINNIVLDFLKSNDYPA